MSVAVLVLAAATATVVPYEKATIEAGPGLQTCAKFANAYAIDPTLFETQYFSWAQGFMSGMNAFYSLPGGVGGGRDLGSVPIKGQESFLRSYCNKHPLADYREAVDALYGSMAPASPAPK